MASYIPELGRADPTWFGIAAMTLDGALHEVGDSRQPFTIQSISKPLTYGLILDDLGEDAVRARIGVEPTGEGGWMDAPGLVSGSAGVALALLAAVTPIEPTWDRVFLTCVPPVPSPGATRG